MLSHVLSIGRDARQGGGMIMGEDKSEHLLVMLVISGSGVSSTSLWEPMGLIMLWVRYFKYIFVRLLRK